nr:CopG family transcriptional regulator [Desulfobacula sp.]
MKKRIGVIGLVADPSMETLSRVRLVLSDHAALIIGKMEIADVIRDVTVMALAIEATTDEVGALTGKLGNLPDVRVKTSLI